MRFTEDGKFVYAGNMDSVKFWDIESGRASDIVMKPQGVLLDIALTPSKLYGNPFPSLNDSC